MAKTPAKAQKAPQPPFTTGRITAAHGRHFMVTTPGGETFEAHRRGKKGDVVVGDLVECTEPQSGVAAIEAVLPRKSLLFRSDEWRIKSLAANVDLVAVVYASHPTFNPWFVWKALLAAHQAGVDALVVRNKCDLEDPSGAAGAQAALLRSIGHTVVELSALRDGPGTREGLIPHFSGRAVLLVGQSGMGKSTILNELVPRARAQTREFSVALDLGKQTTTASRWYEAEKDDWRGSIVDTPGFQEFGLAHLSLNDILRAMPDIASHIDHCRYFNCRHLKEPGCSVKAALGRGLISPERYAFYCSLAEKADSLPL